MGQAVSQVLPFAVGVGISPIPIIAAILVLFSARARVNGPVFLAGWVLGLTVVVTVVYSLADASDVADDSTASDSVSWLKIVLGLVLLGAAYRNWSRRPGPGEQPEMPKWMAEIDHFTPVKTFGLALALSAANPKNLILAASAAAGVAQLGVDGSDAVVALAVFVLVGSASVALAVGYYLVGGAKARATLTELQGWLSVHNDAVMAVLFLVFGVVVFSEGLGLLSA
ncbi:MAG: GAP family protein [Acidimicrobiales bacterium]|jgi:hypothetical protein|nr:GAP family protein [Acidimicrobiales bacterium]